MLNPPAGGGITVPLHGAATLVYDLAALSFRPNELDIHLMGTEAGRAQMAVSRVLGVASLPHFEGASRIEVRGLGAGSNQRVTAYYAA